MDYGLIMSERRDGVEHQYDRDDDDCDSDDDLGSDPDSLLVLGIEVPHESGGRLEAAVVFLCHTNPNQGSI